MITDKNGKEIMLHDILKYLVGTDSEDAANSVIDFSVYKQNDDNSIGKPEYYLIASEAVVTQISFMGPFTMIEIDFRNLGVSLLQQVMDMIRKFHSDINSERKILLSTITSLKREATHTMSLINPLVYVRGFSSENTGSTILQLIYATDNIAFSTYDIDYTKVDADISRELNEIEAVMVTKEKLEAAAYDEIDTHNKNMQEAFKPDFTKNEGYDSDTEDDELIGRRKKKHKDSDIIGLSKKNDNEEV